MSTMRVTVKVEYIAESGPHSGPLTVERTALGSSGNPRFAATEFDAMTTDLHEQIRTMLVALYGDREAGR